MSLLTEAQALSRRPGGTCGVTLLVRRLSESEQAELHEAIWARDDTDRWSVASQAISDALKERGHVLPRMTIDRHRRRECHCDAP